MNNSYTEFDKNGKLKGLLLIEKYRTIHLKFIIKGKTYQERKANLKDLAIEYSNIVGDINLSYGELNLIQEFFCKNGKRYGLLTEFKENCIC